MNGEQTKIITLNVGGRVFSTTLTTLLSHPDSVLARMFSNDGSAVMPPAMTDSGGHYFIDRDPDAFAVILNYLRTGKFHLNGHCTGEQLRDEAIYFGLDRLVEDITAAAGAAARSDDAARNDTDARRQILIIEVKGGSLCGPIKGLSIRAGIHLFKSSPIRNSLGVELPIVAGKDVRAVLFSCPREEDEVPVAEAIGLEREMLHNWKFYWSKAEMVEPSNLGMHRFGDLARANTAAT